MRFPFFNLFCLLMVVLPMQLNAAKNLLPESKTVFVNFMVNFSTPEISGSWNGWNYSNKTVHHNPSQTNAAGRHNIASCYYPIIGPYDMSDPLLAEYHCQLMKMAGIDGATFDVGLYFNPNAKNQDKTADDVKVVRCYLDIMKKYDLRGVLMYEDKSHWLWDTKLKTREETVAAGLRDLTEWMKLFMESDFRIQHRMVIYIFSYGQNIGDRGMSRFLPNELRMWKNSFSIETRPILLTQDDRPDYVDVFDGFFEWPMITGGPGDNSNYIKYNTYEKEGEIWESRTSLIRQRLAERRYKIVCGGVWPGFDDEGCWGWGSGHRGIDRADGALYDYHWKRIRQAGYSFVQIATWNDWFEGSGIEPSSEYGYEYLEKTRRSINKWKKIQLPVPPWELPAWIYQTRKKNSDPAALLAANQACSNIQNGDYSNAMNVVKPYWTGSAQKGVFGNNSYR